MQGLPGTFSYAPVCGRAHILPPQQPLPSFFDIVPHLPSAQQLILSPESFDIIGQALRSFPLQHLLPDSQHLASLPQHAIFLPSAWSWLQHAQVLAVLSPVVGGFWVVFCAMRARAIRRVLAIKRAFDFIVFPQNFPVARIISAKFWSARLDERGLKICARNRLNPEIGLEIKHCFCGEREGNAYRLMLLYLE
jgi:hypothetical protein